MDTRSAFPVISVQSSDGIRFLRPNRIRKPVHRLRIQEAVRDRNEQGTADKLHQFPFQRKGSGDRPDLPEYRAPGRQGTGQESRVRFVLSEQIQAATGLSAREIDQL